MLIIKQKYLCGLWSYKKVEHVGPRESINLHFSFYEYSYSVNPTPYV